jgi:hypothetical protein
MSRGRRPAEEGGTMRTRAGIVGLALLISGCASNSTVETAALPSQANGFQPDGSYRLSADEMTLDCASLTQMVDNGLPRLKELSKLSQAGTGLSLSPILAQLPFTKAATPAANATTDYNRERTKLVAYNGALSAKQCATVDIDAKLQAQGGYVPASGPVEFAPAKTKT